MSAAVDPAEGAAGGTSLAVTEAASATGAVLDFAPVPVAHRHDGWTAERQRAFIEALADSGSVTIAAKV